MSKEAPSLFDTIMHRLDLVTQGKHPAGKSALRVVKELQSILDESSLVAEERIHARTHLAAAFRTIDPNYDLSLLPLAGEFDLGATVSPETLKSLDAIEANIRHAAANASNVVVGGREPNRFDLLFRGKVNQEGLKSV